MDMSSSDDENQTKSKDKAFHPDVRVPSKSIPLAFDKDEDEY